jgi:DNA polymerase III epsilon subunit-like protein
MYVSIDIETLGVDPETCDIIEFGAVIDDMRSPLDKLPTFHRYLLPPNGRKGIYHGQPFAMAMHADKLKKIAELTAGESKSDCLLIPPHWLPLQLYGWLGSNGYEAESKVKIVVAGKNFPGFDQRFLRRIEGFENRIQISRRVHDPAELYFDPKTDLEPPGLNECLKRAGLDKTVTHNALDDAYDVIRVLRHKWDIPCN